MNTELLDSLGQNYPEEFDGNLECSSIALTCTFNRWGSLLAVGCNDGRVVIIDFITRGSAKIISAHAQPICSLAWSRDGRKLLTASTDNSVCLWDVLSGDCDHLFRFPSPVLKVQFHPREATRFIVSPLKHATVLVSTEGEHKVIPCDDELGVDLNITASFDRTGQHIYTGNAKGKISVFNSDTLQLAASFRLPNVSHSIRSLLFSKKNNIFLVNSGDRVIRVFNTDMVVECGVAGEPSPLQKFADLVNKVPWKTCCFSGDDEHVCAASAKNHSLYMWETKSGSLVKILHGTKGEALLDVVWHPCRPVICSIANGVISVWAQSHVENWSAFAPDFKELDENVEYEERESEFDIEDEDKSVELNGESVQEDVDVDVVTVDPPAVFCGSSGFNEEDADDPNALWFLPICPEIEDPEESSFTTSQSTDASAISPSKLHEIILSNAPIDEMHPLFQSTRKRSATSTPINNGINKNLAKLKKQ